MRSSIVKAKLARNEPALITCLHLTDASLYELVSLMGFDGIWMDMEHHGYTVETATNLMRASRVGRTDIMARPAKGEFMRLGRMLEAGALGVLYPRCDDADEAAEVVKWVKFAPLGRRGFDGGNPDQPYCAMDMSEYVRFANEQTWVAIQLEEQSAVDNAEAIAAVEGVDIIFLGPADFSVISGIPGQFNHPKVQKAVEKIARAAKNTGKHWGLPVGTAQRAQELMDMGARFICHGADLVWVMNALKKIQQDFGNLGFTFDNQYAQIAEARSYLEKV
jgi:4-hydroxy-2-oxoheptanedioate aldolase